MTFPTITPKKWGEFQHYKDRRPPWIKLQRTLLDDYDFACLPLASRALAPCLWLLASEFEGGQIPADLGLLAFRLHCPAEMVIAAVLPLVDKGFFIASAPLAWRYQETRLEGETQEQEQEELPIATQSGAQAPESDPIFGVGLDFLKRKGVPERNARSFLGGLRRDVRDELTVIALLTEAEGQDVSDPCAWLTAAAKSRKTGPPPSKPASARAGTLTALEDMKRGLADSGSVDGDAKTYLPLLGGRAGS